MRREAEVMAVGHDDEQAMGERAGGRTTERQKIEKIITRK